MNAPTRPKEEIARLGQEIYQRDVLPKVEDGHFGKYAAIDVDTGDWAIANSAKEAWSACGCSAPARLTF